MGSSGSNRPPKTLPARIRRAMGQWGLTAESIELIHWKRKQGAGLWRVQTSEGARCVKLSSRPLDRCRFTADAHEHLATQGARVPSLHRTLTGEPFAQIDGQALILTDWIDLQAAPFDASGAAALCEGLGAFHHLSAQFTPSAGARFHTRLGLWPKAYATAGQRAALLASRWRPSFTKNPLLGDLLDRLVRQTVLASEYLARSRYAAFAAEGERYWGLVHRDPSWINLQLGPDGVWAIDLDSAVFDLPVSDLALFISETLDRRGRWDLAWLEPMLASYQSANPLDPDLYHLLLIELARPTQLYKRLRKLLKKSGVKASEASLLQLLALDHTRCKSLASLGLQI